MMQDEKNGVGCRYCFFAKRKDCNIVGAWVGECRRFPPLILVVPAGQVSGAAGQMVVQWPIVQGGTDFFCYEFRQIIKPGDVIDLSEANKPAGTWAALDRLEKIIKNLHEQVKDYFNSHLKNI